MPQPSIANITYDPFLTNVSIAYFQDQTDYAVTQVFPMLPSANRSGKITGWAAADLLRDDMQRRAPGSGYLRIGAGTSQLSFSVEEWGLEWPVDDLIRAASMAPYNLDVVAARGLAQKALIKMERAWVADFFTTGVWTTDLVGGTDFTQVDDQTSDPVGLIKSNKRLVKLRSGKTPNVLVLGQSAWDYLSEHTDLHDRLGSATEKRLTMQQVAAMMELDKIVVSNAIYNVNQEGMAFSGASIAGKHALLAYTTATPAENEPTAGYTVVWTGWIPGGNLFSPVSNYREESIRSTVHRIDMAWDNLKVSADLGVFFSNFTSQG